MKSAIKRICKITAGVASDLADGLRAFVATNDVPRKYVVGVRADDGLPVQGDCAPREVEATSPEQAAERRVLQIASELHAMGAPSNGTYHAIIDGTTYRVVATLLHKAEVSP